MSENENNQCEAVKTSKKFEFNQIHFTILVAVITVVLVYYVCNNLAPESSGLGGAAVRISSSSLQNCALWLVMTVSFIEFLNGLKCNVYHEIINEHNTSLANLVGFAMLSMAYCIVG